jgi:hypothetical protein
MVSSWAHGLRRPVISTTASAPSRSRAQQIDAACRDVLAHLTGLHREAVAAQFIVQFGVDQVHLAQVGLARVASNA